ncbi:MAG: GNAT family N-acetyltransferase [Eubacteriales bacterium]
MQIKQELIGSGIVIRNATKDDLPFLTEMWFDEENGKYLSDPTRAYVDEVYRKALDELPDSKQGYYFVIWLNGTDRRIGSCCAFPSDDRTVYDIGYCIHKKDWKQGYGTEAVGLLIDWIRRLGAERITAEVAADNAASNALMRKCGFEVRSESKFKKYNMEIRYKSYVYQKILT